MAEWVFRVEQAGIAILLLLSVATAFATPAPLKRLMRRAARLARHRRLAVVSVGLVAAAVATTISLIRAPAPIGHDEQSYLLAADTFAHGRLTNPTHPMWRHFESFHIIQQPTYASKYPPGQGLVLALGQAISGDPAAGLWLSTGLAAAAVCWMLYGWVPPRWALLGGGLVVFHVFIQLAWGQSFWGGDVALIGGALLFGALPRHLRKPQTGPALLMALGLVILANSRPYEGLVAALPVAVALLARWFGKRRPSLGTAAARVILPMGIVLSMAAAAMAYYNLRVTGDPLKMPYQVHEETYMGTPVFLWQSPRPQPAYRHEVMRSAFMDGPTCVFRHQQGLYGFLSVKASAWTNYLLHFFLRPTLTLPLVTLPWVLKKRSMRLALAALGFACAGSLATTWVLPHYLAPAVPLLFVLVVQGIRELRRWTWDGKPCGRSVVLGLAVLYGLIFILSVYQYATVQRTGIARYRPEVLAQLERLPGRHLVVVRYGPEHYKTINDEWVYNAADIDAAQVVWAREMQPAENRQLFDYFRDRQVWLLLADAAPPRLRPYPREEHTGRITGAGDKPCVKPRPAVAGREFACSARPRAATTGRGFTESSVRSEPATQPSADAAPSRGLSRKASAKTARMTNAAAEGQSQIGVQLQDCAFSHCWRSRLISSSASSSPSCALATLLNSAIISLRE